MLRRGDQGPQAGDKLQQTYLAQPAVFVIEYCLAQLLMSWGIVPKALMGYSLGEYVAATVAGSLTLEDALPLVALRAKLIDGLPTGSMLAVPMSEGEVEELLDERLSIAICNSPKTTIVSGETSAIEGLGSAAAQAQRDDTSAADDACVPLGDDGGRARGLARSVERGTAACATDPYLSNLTGTWIHAGSGELTGVLAGSPVPDGALLADGVGELLKEKDRVLVEVGAGQSLGSFIKQHPGYGQEVPPVVIATLRAAFQQQSDEEVPAERGGAVWLAGIEADWKAYHEGQPPAEGAVASYVFDRQRYWIEAAAEVSRRRRYSRARSRTWVTGSMKPAGRRRRCARRS